MTMCVNASRGALVDAVMRTATAFVIVAQEGQGTQVTRD